MPTSLEDFTNPARGWYAVEPSPEGWHAELGWALDTFTAPTEREAVRWAQAHGGKRRLGGEA